MKCQFCQQDCKPMDDTHYVRETNDISPVNKYTCDNHPRMILYWIAEDAVFHYLYYVERPKGKYAVTYRKKENLWSLSLIRKGNGAIEQVVKLHFEPQNITPDNIEQKLSTLLLYS